MKSPKLFLLFTLCFILSTFLIGCAHLAEYSQNRDRLAAISAGDLKGLGKVEVIKKFGRPSATTESEVSESWYYDRPREIWFWFDKDGKVERWEVK